jgi:hypothetical protein
MNLFNVAHLDIGCYSSQATRILPSVIRGPGGCFDIISVEAPSYTSLDTPPDRLEAPAQPADDARQPELLIARRRVADVDGNLQAFEHFYVARKSPNFSLADAARSLQCTIFGPALKKFAVCTLLVVHAALVILRHGQIDRLVDGDGRLTARLSVKLRRAVGDRKD